MTQSPTDATSPGAPRHPPALQQTADGTTFHYRGDHITLDALLKAAGLAASGGDAKQRIAAGAVQVNGEIETRRGRKLRAADLVVLGGQRVVLAAQR